MDAITLTAAEEKLAETIDSVCKNHTPVIVTRDSDQAVVIISLEDFNSIQESMYLLGEPANAERLRTSIVDAEKGKTTTVDLDML